MCAEIVVQALLPFLNSTLTSTFAVIKRVKGVRYLTFEESTISQWLFLQLHDKGEIVKSEGLVGGEKACRF